MRKLLVVILIGLFLIPFIPQAAHAVLAIDTSATADTQGGTQCGNTQSTCTTAQFSTANAVERLIAFGTGKNPTATMTLADNSGLTWTKRTTDLTVGSGVKFAEWTAVTSSQLVNDRITLTVGAASGNSLVIMVAVSGSNIQFDQAVQTQSCALATSCSEPIGTYNHATTLVVQGLSTDDLASSTVTTNCAGSGCTELVQTSWTGTVRASEQYTAQQPATVGYTEGGVVENLELITEVLNEPVTYTRSLSGNIGTASSGSQTNTVPIAPSLPPGTVETGRVLFRDDFTGNFNTQARQVNAVVDSQWLLDYYYPANSGFTTPGIWTFNGYANLRVSTDPSTKTIPFIESLHPTTPAWNNNVTVTRQYTVALIPFDFYDKASGSAWVRMGFAPLITNGTYPTPTPRPFQGVYGTVNTDANQDCGKVTSPNMSGNKADFYGMEYIDISDNGTAIAVSCARTGFQRTTLGVINPLTYTIVTITYFSIPTGNLNAHSWTFYSVRQLSSDGTFTSPLTLNVTDANKQTPTYQTNYLFLSQLIDPAASGQYVTSKVDLINLQSFQGLVSLAQPPPLCAYNCVAQTLTIGGVLTGFGDLFQLGEPGGVIIFFFILAGLSIAGVAYASQHIVPTILTGFLELGIFAYAGVFDTWVLTLIILTTTFLCVMIVRSLIEGSGLRPGQVQTT